MHPISFKPNITSLITQAQYHIPYHPNTISHPLSSKHNIPSPITQAQYHIPYHPSEVSYYMVPTHIAYCYVDMTEIQLIRVFNINDYLDKFKILCRREYKPSMYTVNRALWTRFWTPVVLLKHPCFRTLPNTSIVHHQIFLLSSV